MTALVGIGGERQWVHIPRRNAAPRAYKSGGLVAAAEAVKGSPLANEFGDTELVHVNKYEMEKLREMWGEPGINPETGLPAYGWFGKILGGIAKIAGTVLLTPVLGPVGAAAAVSAASGVVEGKSVGDIVKGAALSAVTAGAGQIGGKVLPGLTGGFLNEAAGQAIGAGLGTAGGALATGANLEQALMAGAASGIGTYGSNQLFDKVVNNNILGLGDAANFLWNTGVDISGATGIDLGGATSDWFVPKIDGPSAAFNNAFSPEYQAWLDAGAVGTPPPVSGIGGVDTGTAPIVVSGNPVTGGTTITTGGGGATTAPSTQTGGETQEPAKDENGNPIVVTGNPVTGGTTITTGGGATTGGDTGGNQIVVTGNPATGTDLTTGGGIVVTGNPSTGTDLTTGGGGIGGGGGGTGGGVTGGVTIYDNGPGVATGGTEVPLLVPRGGTYDTSGNRSDIFGTRGVADITFDPFTYGQATGGQPGEYLFFTQNGKPYGLSAAYNPPSAAVEAAPTAGIGAIATPEAVVAPATAQSLQAIPVAESVAPVAYAAQPALNISNLSPAQKLYYDELSQYPGSASDNLAYVSGLNDYQALASLANYNSMLGNQIYNGPNGFRTMNELEAAFNTPITNYGGGQTRVSSLVDPAAAAAQAAAVPMKDGGEAYADDDTVKHLLEWHKGGGHSGPGQVKGIGSGQEDKIPAWLSDGEYVWSAQDVADLGDGSTDEGVRRLDKMRHMVRRRAGRKDVKKIAKPQQGIDTLLKAVGGSV